MIVFQKFIKKKIFKIPKTNTITGSMRISVFLPRLINEVLRNYVYFDFKDFKNLILTNIIFNYSKYAQLTN